MKRNYILILLLLLTSTAFSQSVTTRDITWNSAKSVELHSSVDVNQSCKLVTRSNKQVDLVQSNGTTLTFLISSITGTWSDPNTNGSITYKVTYQSRPGKITIQRTAAGIVANIDFTESAANALQQKILIDSFQ
jgi:hypothetical protein